MTRQELIGHFEKIAKREGFVLTRVQVQGTNDTGFILVKPGPLASKRKAEPDESMNWDKWKKLP